MRNVDGGPACIQRTGADCCPRQADCRRICCTSCRTSCRRGCRPACCGGGRRLQHAYPRLVASVQQRRYGNGAHGRADHPTNVDSIRQSRYPRALTCIVINSTMTLILKGSSPAYPPSVGGSYGSASPAYSSSGSSPAYGGASPAYGGSSPAYGGSSPAAFGGSSPAYGVAGTGAGAGARAGTGAMTPSPSPTYVTDEFEFDLTAMPQSLVRKESAHRSTTRVYA